MKTKILLAIAALLIVMVIAVRYLYSQKFEEFKKNITKYESERLDNFIKEKENRIAALSNDDKEIMQLFTEQFDENKSFSERDTTFSFLYLSGNVKYKTASLKYIDCLNNKCLLDKRNEETQKLIATNEKQLEKQYGETFLFWYPKFKDEKLLLKTNKSGDCSNYFPELSEISFNQNVWNDFEKFMIIYNSETLESELRNRQIEKQYSSNVASTLSQLRKEAISYFEEILYKNKSQIISTQSETKTFNSPTLGIITYSINKTSFDKDAFQSVADDTFEEQWKNNSLSTGATPYSNCFGSTNDCDYYGCSQITVRTGGSDVLVTIKDRSGDVVRHGYINAGHSFSFNLPDGTYQVFFYSGAGWNPNKAMNSKSCGTLHGGFISGENISKDNFISLYNQKMMYELILQKNGNLSTQPSSMSEAF
jgi:hypothetical protein